MKPRDVCFWLRSSITGLNSGVGIGFKWLWELLEPVLIWAFYTDKVNVLHFTFQLTHRDKYCWVDHSFANVLPNNIQSRNRTQVCSELICYMKSILDSPMEELHKGTGREDFPWLPFILSAAWDVFLCCVTYHSQPLCPLVLCSAACVSILFTANIRHTDLFVKWHAVLRAAWRAAMFHSCSLLKQEHVFQRYPDTLAFSLNWSKVTCDGCRAMAWFYNECMSLLEHMSQNIPGFALC